METSAQPVLAITAIFRCSSMATAPGAEAVPEHAGTGTDSSTVKSETLETTFAPLTTSRPKRRGTARNEAGIVTSISRSLTIRTLPGPGGKACPSSQTCELVSKPEPKILTPVTAPEVLPLVVSTDCGNSAPGIAGVMTCSMCTGLMN